MNQPDPFASGYLEFENPGDRPAPTERPNRARLVIAAAAAIALAATSALAFWPQDHFSQPNNLGSFITKVRDATVTIYCGSSSGSGWVIDLRRRDGSPLDENQTTQIVTNFHVIEDCIDSGGVSFTSPVLSGLKEARIFDHEGVDFDLALLVTSENLPALKPSMKTPEVGHWAMAVGSPGTSNTEIGVLDGNVTFGRVTNVVSYLIATDAAVNFGNSGGPLVNSQGEVIGTNTWLDGEDFTDNIAYAQGIEALCQTLIVCTRLR